MASLRFIKSRKRWQVRWRAKGRGSSYIFEGSRVFLEKSQAVGFYADIENQERLVRSGKVTPGETISSALEKFRKHIKRHTSRTQQHYLMVTQLFVRSMPKSIIRIHQIESAHIQEYLYQRRDLGAKNRTLNAHLTVIKAFCRFYSDQFNIANPASKVKLLKEDPPDSRFLTKEEYQKLLNIAPDLAKNRIIFLANTGLRASEFAALTFTGLRASGYATKTLVNAYTKSITITGKGRRRRTVPLNKSARQVLPFIQPASRKALFFQLSKLAKKLGLPSFGPNALRHYFGTQLLLNGIPAAKVAKLMGNSVRVIEKHYAHILTADIANATEVLD
ncbi:MAG: tyrosine-type recombinase/integrase [Sedimentisphaerales bacterium]|nr:tyrosine-type recombinase/integrase [Sedimentisphaerales bacterium]